MSLAKYNLNRGRHNPKESLWTCAKCGNRSYYHIEDCSKCKPPTMVFDRSPFHKTCIKCKNTDHVSKFKRRNISSNVCNPCDAERGKENESA